MEMCGLGESHSINLSGGHWLAVSNRIGLAGIRRGVEASDQRRRSWKWLGRGRKLGVSRNGRRAGRRRWNYDVDAIQIQCSRSRSGKMVIVQVWENVLQPAIDGDGEGMGMGKKLGHAGEERIIKLKWAVIPRDQP
ncbi:hypothetical protein ACLOJK_036239 [Asimina triloba]